MPAAALARLRALGVTAEARGDRLTLRPASAISPDLLADLREHKADVLALLALLAANAATTLPTLPPASPEQAADREAIEAEPMLPDPGTPERERLDSRQREMVAGLLLCFERHR